MGYDNVLKEGKLKENKTTDYGFDAILGGWRNYFENFEGQYEIGRWWSSSILQEFVDSYYFYIYRELSYMESGIGNGKCSELCCLSLRCIKDDLLPFTSKAV